MPEATALVGHEPHLFVVERTKTKELKMTDDEAEFFKGGGKVMDVMDKRTEQRVEKGDGRRTEEQPTRER